MNTNLTLIKPFITLVSLLMFVGFKSLSAQVSGTPELASIKGIQQELTDLTHMVVNHWDPDLPQYQEVMKQYIRLRRSFTETTLYMSYYYGLSKRRRKKEADDLKGRIQNLNTLANQYFDYISANDSDDIRVGKSRGFIISLISNFIKNPELIGTAIDEIIALFNQNKNQYLEVINQLNALQLPAWYDFEVDSH